MTGETPPVLLLIEDHADTREMYALVLQHEGFDVVAAATAEEALDLIGRRPPAVVVSDIALPGFDGFELCERIRRVESLREVPIIGITAVTLVQVMVQAKRAGFAEVLTKPCTPDELVSAVRRAHSLPQAPIPKPRAVKAEEKRNTPSERAWRIRARRFGSDRSPEGSGGNGQ
ncbi:MAG: response regulator [Acidobacteria bacterium]|nr:response regulator [Acidobacteriota bacterium]